MTLRITIDGRTLTDQYPGVGRYVWNLARALPRVAGEEEILLLTGPSDDNARFPLGELEAAGVTPVPVRQSLDGLGQKLALPRLLAEIGAQVFHAPHVVVGYRSPCPLVVTVYHALGAMAPERNGHQVSRSLRRTLETARRVITLSQPVKKELGEELGVEPRRVMVIPGASDPDLGTPAAENVDEVRRRLKLPARYVLSLAADKPHKNLVSLIEAWAAVEKAEDDPSDDTWQLVLAGLDDPGRGEAREKTRELGLTGVRFLGAVAEADLAAVLSAAEVFVLPSLAAGSGLALLEAMASGTAIACSQTSALPAVAGAGAAYFDPRNPAAIATALLRLMQNAAYREMLAERGARRAEQFSWDQAARQTLKVYRQAAAEET